MIRCIPLIALALTSVHPAAGQDPVPPQVWDVPVPLGLRNRGSSTTLRLGYQSSAVHLDSVHRKVELTWVASALQTGGPVDFTALQGIDHDLYPVSRRNQEIATTFFPSAACVTSSDRVLIAGVVSPTRTILEEWTFELRPPLPAVVVDPATGAQSVACKPAVRESVRTVFDQDVLGQRIVRSMARYDAPTSGGATQVLVLFDDSTDLYLVDLATGASELFASATNPGGVMGVVPEMSDYYDSVGSSDRPGIGWVYTLQWAKTSARTATDTSRVIVFLDADRDGTPESHQVLTRAQWWQQWAGVAGPVSDY